ncbi:MAG: gliding motility-associated C-terminal domain-containing protein, partial [Saprospiraceae bacterium]
CGENVSGSSSYTIENVKLGFVPEFQVTGGAPSENSTYFFDNIRIEGFPKSIQDANIISSTGNNNKLCEGQDVLILLASPISAENLYNWEGPQGPIGEISSTYSPSNLVSPLDNGEYFVTVTEASGCTSKASINIEVIGADQKAVEARFPFIANRYCENTVDLELQNAAAPNFIRTGTWNINEPLDFSLYSDSTLLIFTYDDGASPPDSMYLRIDTIPSIGNNFVMMDVCVKSDRPFLNLVELFDLNLENIATVFAFGGGRSIGELSRIDVSNITMPGQEIITITSISNGDCDEETFSVIIDFELIEVGIDKIIDLCEDDLFLIFPNFQDSLSLTSNANGVWRDVNNTGLDLTSPTGVDISTLTIGTFDFEYIVSETSICGNPIIDTALLRINVQPDLALNIPTQTIQITCDNLEGQILLDFAFPETNYTITLEATDDQGNVILLGELETIEESHFVNVSATDEVSSLINDTIFLNPQLSSSYTILVSSFTSVNANMCSAFEVTGATMITFDNVLNISIDTSLCDGEVLDFKGIQYTFDATEQILVSGENGCDTMFMLTVIFEPTSIISVDALICQGDFFSFRGVDYTNAVDDLAILSNQGVGCDTTFLLTIDIETSLELQTEVDPCINNGSFRGVMVTADTVFILTGMDGDCDTLYQVLYAPTVAPDSLLQDERCENDPITINGVLYNPDNTTGSFMIVTPEGCMQTVNVLIDFEAGVFKDLDTILCDGEFIMVGGQLFDQNATDGEVIFPEASVTGCDSVVFVSLEFIETVDYTHFVDLCPGQIVTLFDVEVNENTTMNESYSIGPNLCDTLLRFEVNLTEIVLLTSGTPSCARLSNGTIDVMWSGGTAPYSVDIRGNIQVIDTNIIILEDLPTGDIDIIITGANGCQTNETITVDTLDFNLDFQSTQNVQGGLNIDITSDQNISSISWSPPTGLSCDDCTSTVASPMEDQIYTVTAFDDNGCVDSINISITINNNPTDEILFFIPNAFAPSSTLNSRFFLQSPEGVITAYDMSIYNRLGEKVYEVVNAAPNDRSAGWDGRRSGNLLNPGVYVYHIVMRTTEAGTGGTLIKTGDLLLVR